jgi:hypothetical protein
MKWIKRGLIFSPRGQHEWVTTHAMLPVADRIDDDLYRIYFSGRDRLNRSLIGYVEIDINDPQQILELAEKPVLGLGNLGAFDDNGVSPTWLVNHGGQKYLYYFGWNKGSLVRAAEVSGLAISKDGGRTFERHSRAPIIDRTDREPYLILVISCILIEGQTWRMWYDSADEWQNPELPRYNIKYAQSNDGIYWQRDGTVSVNYKSADESRVSRASVLKDDDVYKMWHWPWAAAGTEWVTRNPPTAFISKEWTTRSGSMSRPPVGTPRWCVIRTSSSIRDRRSCCIAETGTAGPDSAWPSWNSTDRPIRRARATLIAGS